MGRKHPPRQRDHRGVLTVKIPGVPLPTCQVLDQLGRAEISSHAVARALCAWDRYTRIPRGPRRLDKDPFDEDAGTNARITLDEAVVALGQRRSAPLRRQVARMDRVFLAATVPDPFVDADRPWWHRRDWF